MGATEPKGGFSGALNAFGFKYSDADEIATTRIDYFKQLNPDVNLTVSESDFSPDGFALAIQDENNPIDVVRMDTYLLGTYVAKGLLAPIDQCFSTMGVDAASTYYSAPLTQATIDGQVYAAPEFLSTVNWFVNQSAFTDAGLDASTFNFGDWNAIKDANTKLAKGTGSDMTAIGIDPKLPEFLPLWAKANGADLISADGKTAQFNDPKVVEAMQFVADLINAQGGRDPFFNFRNTWDFFGGENEFKKDQVAAFPMEQWYLNVLAGSSPDIDLQLAPFMDRNGNPLSYAEGQSIAITTKSKNPDAACAFAVTMTSAAAFQKAAQARADTAATDNSINTGVFSANQQATQAIYSQIDDPSTIAAPFGDAVQVVLESQANAFALPASAGNQSIFYGDNSIMAQAVARVLDGEDAAAVMEETNQEAQQAIDSAGAAAGP